MRKTTAGGFISTLILCYLFWLLVTGQLVALFTGGTSYQVLIAGAIVSAAVAAFSSRFLIHEKAFWLVAKIPQLIVYALFTFPVALIKANLDVAFRSLSPRLKIKPGIVKVPVGPESDYGQAMLANSITLTPGTITMDAAEDEEGRTWFYIHWINVTETDPEKAGEAIKGSLERGVKRIWK